MKNAKIVRIEFKNDTARYYATTSIQTADDFAKKFGGELWPGMHNYHNQNGTIVKVKIVEL
jgi:hypothetical protein